MKVTQAINDLLPIMYACVNAVLTVNAKQLQLKVTAHVTMKNDSFFEL